MRHSWLIEGAEVRSAGAKGLGLFAAAPIATGEIVAAFGGYAMSGRELGRLPTERQVHSIQIADDLFLVGPESCEPADYFNHSCEPNLGIVGSVMLTAIRAIEIGEELTFDYAMSDADDYDEFACLCRTPACRGRVTGRDWMLPELQRRYAGYFSAYLSRRIEAGASAAASLAPAGPSSL